MELATKLLRTQINILKPFISGCSLETVRKTQDKAGSFMASHHKGNVKTEEVHLSDYSAVMVTPKDEIARGIILYLHGGGYTCGDLAYAKGFASVISSKCGIRVFSPAYRLAPENIFPAAFDDALSAYRYLLSLDYKPSDILLCGESAGGGLIFSLCLKLKELGEELPAGIIAISPWTDLTLSGESYKTNKENDPTMTYERLKYFADCYVHGNAEGIKDSGKDHLMKSNKYLSPLFGLFNGFPPSLIFVGSDEILLDDSRLLHEKLIESSCRSRLVVSDGMWHAYVLYGVKEFENDFEKINTFLKMTLPRPKKLRWMSLDNAAKIYPAARRHNWNNLFRISATLNEPIDEGVLRSALDVTVRRFPSISVRLRVGMFWYYLEEIPKAPEIMKEKSYPLTRMPFDDIRKCAFRVLIYNNRIAVEFFHAITDGNGGLVFVKTLVAEYLSQKYNIVIPAENGVLDRLETPSESELEDSFQKNCGNIAASRNEPTAYKITGTRDLDGFRTDTTFMINVGAIHSKAKEYGVTITEYLASVFTLAIMNIQQQKVKNRKKYKPVKVLIPVNLRKLFDSNTLRNFVMFVTPEFDQRLGEYTFEEICKSLHHQMGYMNTAKLMSTKITPNIKSERLLIVRIMPLFIKNLVMKAIYTAVGERKSCLSMSNLGLVKLPDIMNDYVKRFDFVLGTQASAPYNCGIISFKDTMYINIIRNIEEPYLEKGVFEVLKSHGIDVKVESNTKDRSKTKGR